MPPVGKKRRWRPAAEHALKGAIAIDSRGGGCHTDSPSLCAHVGGGREGGREAGMEISSLCSAGLLRRRLASF